MDKWHSLCKNESKIIDQNKILLPSNTALLCTHFITYSGRNLVQHILCLKLFLQYETFSASILLYILRQFLDLILPKTHRQKSGNRPKF